MDVNNDCSKNSRSLFFVNFLDVVQIESSLVILKNVNYLSDVFKLQSQATERHIKRKVTEVLRSIANSLK